MRVKTNMPNPENRVLLSICIPTFRREAVLKELLESILSQGVEEDLYEITVTDNSETDETKDMIGREFSAVPNLRYKKVDCKGFYNSLEALKSGEGRLLKLHNDYSILNPGALRKMIDRAAEAEKDHAQLFFGMGNLGGDEIREFGDYDSFLYDISYFATWSSAFSIWKEDFDRILAEGIVPDTMYPHTSFLHRVTGKQRYIADNTAYAHSIEPKTKGGYNLVDNFARIYLTMVREDLLAKKHISQRTYDKIEDGILRFCADWYYTVLENPEKYTFRFDNGEEIIRGSCGDSGVRRYRKYKRKRFFKSAARRCRKLLRK